MGFKDNASTLILFCYLLFTSLFNTTLHANDLEMEDESSFFYVVGAPNGPENWGKLNPSWRLCGTAQSQSPINLLQDKVVVLSRGSFPTNYTPAPATIRNRGHDIRVRCYDL
ncbi:hypothetical protein ACJIZ3_008267 [Penstemon smallii]|uniref:Alpha-carbonic anhydrase domain-containing protein n=1 Tax=Penstemon smallii TaxID=265156 RepID=A0ABD3TA76_9LAMI